MRAKEEEVGEMEKTGDRNKKEETMVSQPGPFKNAGSDPVP